MSPARMVPNGSGKPACCSIVTLFLLVLTSAVLVGGWIALRAVWPLLPS